MNALQGPTAQHLASRSRRAAPGPRRPSSTSSGNDIADPQPQPPVGVQPLPHLAAAGCAGSRGRRRRPRRSPPSCRRARPVSARARVGSGSGKRHASHSPKHARRARSTPVARIAALLTHSVWWSCAHSAAGRSPVTASSAAAVGGPSGHAADSQPCPSSHSPLGSVAADRRQRLGRAGAARQVELRALQRPLQEVRVAVGEPGQHAAAVEVEPLVADRVHLALADVDAAGDAVAGDRQRGRPAAGADPSCRWGRCGGSRRTTITP